MRLRNVHILATVLATGQTAAVTQITDDDMTSLLNQGGAELADRYAPMWFFGQALNQPPCYPTWAFGGSPTSNDVYDSSHKTPAAAQCEYPDVGCKCRNPGVAIKNRAPDFPIYYTFKRCSDTEVRVAYNLFYEKDGAKVIGVIDTGHDYDWERVIIIHSRDGNNMWAPSRALLSSHSGYHNLAWGDIQNTLTTEEIEAGDANDPNGVRNNDHPKVYISWSKHAHFDTRNTGWVDPISQSTDNAFRSNDWWHYVDKKYYARGSYLITDYVETQLPEIKNYKVGILHLFIKHTSCALSLNENWDDDVQADMSDALERIVPYDKKGNLYRHSAEGEDDMPAHVKSALIGASVSIPISNGQLATGTWQGIWYLEFRAQKHRRNVVATIQGEKNE
ncbi:hypothetical protein AARAC_009581 [Aspergillus arachidicola]|uniref:Uncharacterized protein n=1 Tax=Aspergillus arachidicola TaxID=656916 RepID=A0A2G7ELC8_9EURO|nr:hypothetical protein AARAC_009581 [Aspergillus arachidicola]